MIGSGEIVRVWFLGDNGTKKKRRAIVLDLYPDDPPKVAVVISGMGFEKSGVPNVSVHDHLDRHWFNQLKLEKTTFFHDDDIKYYALPDVLEAKGRRCPHKLFKKLEALYHARLDAGAAIEFNVSPPEVPEPPYEVIRAAVDHRLGPAPAEGAPSLADPAGGPDSPE